MSWRKTKFIRLFFLIICVLVTVGLTAAPSFAALREGDRGNTVKQVQQKLKDWGYYTGAVDGIFGPKTTAAVKYFQRKNNLTVDGIVGKQTFAALGMSEPSSGKGSYSSDIDLLSRMIAAEGRGEPYLGQVAIGAVIMNRVKSPNFPNTISGVLYQPGAFTAVTDGQFYSTAVPDSCRRAATEAYNGYDPTYGCIYYYNPSKATSSFIFSRPAVVTIGDHVFCK